jgi:fructose-specific phosphotransferase system IIC component
LCARIPRRHWKTTAFVAGLGLSGMMAPLVVLDGPISKVAFQAYAEKVRN